MIGSGKLENLDGLLSDYPRVRVADYQRNYDWEPQNVQDLWGDLKDCADGDYDHFFGSLILQKDGSDGDQAAFADLVDGQQRLTTVFIFIARLRDELNRVGFEKETLELRGEEFDLGVEMKRFLGKGSKSYKFIPSQLIQSYFKEISKEPVHGYKNDREEREDAEGRTVPIRSREPDSGRTLSIRSNYHLVKKIIQEDLDKVRKKSDPELVNEQVAYRILRLFDALTQRFKVLPITTENQSESLDVFLTTNDRGLDLGVFDLVRGQILRARTKEGIAASAAADIFRESLEEWEALSELVGSSKQIDAFLRHLLHLHPESIQKTEKGDSFTRVTMKKVPGFTDQIIGGSSAKARSLWDFILEGANAYNSIISPDPSFCDFPTALRLHALRAQGDSYRIFAMKCARYSKTLSKQEIARLIEKLSIYVFRWNLAQENAQELETELQKLAHYLGEHGVKQTLVELESRSKAISLQVEEKLSAGVSEKWAKALLFLVEADLSSNTSFITEFELEHIAPQSANDGWKEALNLEGADYSSKIKELGNLTLLDKPLNNSIKRKPFTAKKDAYKDAKLEQTKQLLGYNKWTVYEIDSRSTLLASQLVSILS
jgi:hypothetical protein